MSYGIRSPGVRILGAAHASWQIIRDFQQAVNKSLGTLPILGQCPILRCSRDSPPANEIRPQLTFLRLSRPFEETSPMVRTPSTMLPLGTKAPDFSLINVDGQTVSLADFDDAPALLVMFICNHCPFVIHIADPLAQLTHEYLAKGVAIVGINSNDVANYPADSPEQMVAEAESRGYAFAYLYDETQEVAHAYHAACTPDFFLFDGEKRLVYRGQLDSSRPDSGIPVTGEDLRAALDAVLAGEPVAKEQRPSLGCNIKWKLGNEPEYFST